MDLQPPKIITFGAVPCALPGTNSKTLSSRGPSNSTLITPLPTELLTTLILKSLSIRTLTQAVFMSSPVMAKKPWTKSINKLSKNSPKKPLLPSIFLCKTTQYFPMPICWKSCRSWQSSKDCPIRISLSITNIRSMLFMLKNPIKENKFNTVNG